MANRSKHRHRKVIDLVGRVTHVGRTSVRVSIDMFREESLTGRRDLCTTGVFAMVAVDDEGRPTPAMD